MRASAADASACNRCVLAFAPWREMNGDAAGTGLAVIHRVKPHDQVYRWMTPSPQTVERDATVAEARALMRRFDIRHLPVLDAGSLVGIVSERDLSFAERFVDPRKVTVGEVMTPDPYVVVPYEPLEDVAGEMAKHKFGAAIVVDKGSVVGVFTAIDGLRALAENRGYRGAVGARAP